METILSDPCFEYWLLLHFELTDRPFDGAGTGRSACEEVTARLRSHLPEYRKNDLRIFKQCRERLDAAVRNARRVEENPSSQSPRTDVWKLIVRLLEIGRKSDDARGNRT